MFTKDALQASLSFVESQTSHIEAQVNEVNYPDIQYPQLIPVDTSADAFAKTVTHYTSDQFGAAGWINGNADDIPLAGTDMKKEEKPIYMAGIGYGWGWEEAEQARSLGRNLAADDARAARRAYEEFVDGVALTGDTQKGFEGLINHSSVTAGSAPNGTWASATEDEMLEDVNSNILGVGTATKYTAMADTVLFSYEKLNYLSTNRLGDTGESILSFLLTNNTYTQMTGQPLTVRAVRGLETAGATSSERMVAYRRDPDVLKLYIPMPHRFLPVYQTGALNFVVPGVFRLGGLDVRRPAEVRYSDGI